MPFLDEYGLNEFFKGSQHEIIRRMTQAEYDALTDAEKRGPVMITDQQSPVSLAISVQDYTTEDGWHVRKYSDGYVELCKAVFRSIAVSEWEESANGWQALVFKYHPLPITLTARYSEYLCLTGGSSGPTGIFYQENSTYDGTKTGWWQAFRPWSKPTSSITLQVKVSITGRWKG